MFFILIHLATCAFATGPRPLPVDTTHPPIQSVTPNSLRRISVSRHFHQDSTDTVPSDPPGREFLSDDAGVDVPRIVSISFRNRRARRVPSPILFDSYEPEPPSLPSIVNVPEDLRAQDGSVCLNSLGNGEEVSKTRCGHYFHTACVNRWIAQRRSCPMCRELT